jgi:hypothetical protein
MIQARDRSEFADPPARLEVGAGLADSGEVGSDLERERERRPIAWPPDQE